MALVEIMTILNKEQSLEIKKRLAKKMKVENSIIDWSSLSGDAPLWNLTKLQRVYEDLIVINNKGRGVLLKYFSDFLSEQRKSILMFPADGFIVSFYFGDLNQSKNDIKSRPIIEVNVADLKNVKEIPKWITPEDVYFFDEEFSWLLFLCHEKFQVLCGMHDFISRFKNYWIDYKYYIDDKWSELFLKIED